MKIILVDDDGRELDSMDVDRRDILIVTPDDKITYY